MGFIDLFRPRWKHSDVDVRTEAVRHLDDVQALVRVAREDKDARVRRIALKRIEDPAILEEIAARDPDTALRELAAEKAQGLLVAAAAAGQGAALARLKSDRDLAEVVRRATTDAARGAALARVGDDRVLLELVRKLEAQEAKLAALARIKDGAALRDVALGEDNKAVALAAVARVEDVGFLEEIARSAKVKAARTAARDRAPAPAEAATATAAPAPRAAPAARAGDKTRRARLLALAVAAEAAAARNDWDAAGAELRELEGRFAEIESAPGDEAVEKRFADALKRFEARHQAELAAKQRAAEAAAKKAAEAKARARAAAAAAPPPPAPAPEPAPAPPPEPAPPAPVAAPSRADTLLLVVLEAEKLAAAPKISDTRVAELVRRFREGDDAEDASLAELRERFAKAEGMMVARLADEKAMREARAAEARGKLEKAINDLERAASGTSVKGAENALRVGQQTLKSLQGPAVPGVDDELRGKLRAALDKLTVRSGELREAESWKRFANVPKLEELCKEAEALAGVIGEVEDKSRAPALLKDLQARWKAVGPAPNDKHEALWTRFKAACDAVYEKTKEFFGKLDEERGGNLTRKEELCARVEALVDSTEWKETSEKIKALQEEWKAIGPVPQDKADAVWKRFRAACDAFFDRRKANDTTRDAERAANLEKKLGLITRVEGLATSTQWRETADAIKAAQEEWQAIGPVPRADSDAVWKRFRAACDTFFDRRKAAFAQLDEERKENLAQKTLLCEKAEALADADDPDAALSAVKELQAEWKGIGPVPKDQSDEIWRRFRTACDVVYAGPKLDAEAAAAAAAPSGDGSGVSGFSNKLPLEGIVARLAATPPAPAAAPEATPAAAPPVMKGPEVDALGDTLPAIPTAKKGKKPKTEKPA